MAKNARSLTTLYISFRDESIKPITVSITRSLLGGFNKTIKFRLPPGDEIEIYVEVNSPDTAPDVSLYITDTVPQIVGIRCTSGMVISYVAKCGYECLFHVGTGPWE